MRWFFHLLATNLGAAPDAEIEKLVSLKADADEAPPLVANDETGDGEETTEPDSEDNEDSR